MVRIAVCRKCSWSDDEIKRALKDLRKAHPKSLRLKKKDCLESCKRKPAVRVGKKLVAPATPDKLRRRIEKKLKA